VPVRAQTLSAKEIHDRIGAAIARSGYSHSAADTFVSWSPLPILFHLVTRKGATIETAMIRADGLVGESSVAYHDGAPDSATVKWSGGGRSPRIIRLHLRNDSLVVDDTTSSVSVIPGHNWLIADYGMDDLLLPAFNALRLNRPVELQVYRPYMGKWDRVIAQRRGDAAGEWIELNAGDGDLWTLVQASDGSILQITRTKYPDFERRPLEESSRVAAYMSSRRAHPASASKSPVSKSPR
jgi:hypothetical protein